MILYDFITALFPALQRECWLAVQAVHPVWISNLNNHELS